MQEKAGQGSQQAVSDEFEDVNEEDAGDEAYESIEPEETMVRILPSPHLPSQKDIDEHHACHLPYRNWCPMCVKSRSREDAHPRVEVRRDGKPIVAIDCKSFGAYGDEVNEEDDKMFAVVMRGQETGMAGYLAEAKGDWDKWVVDRLVSDLADWGLTDIILKTDGEPAILPLQKANATTRKRITAHNQTESRRELCKSSLPNSEI